MTTHSTHPEHTVSTHRFPIGACCMPYSPRLDMDSSEAIVLDQASSLREKGPSTALGPAQWV